MNGPHDMGGMQCYGPVEPEADEPVFHGEWEKRALALTVGMGFGGKWNIDASRYARESLPPVFYLSSSYYQIWIAGLQKLMLERGMVNEQELESGTVQVPPVELARVVSADEMSAALAKGGPAERKAQGKPLFTSGQAVKSANFNPSGHTRLPRYARGKNGEIVSVHGCHVFPDTNARGEGESPQWLYSVAFDATELFGPSSKRGDQVMIDCWESYLEPD